MNLPLDALDILDSDFDPEAVWSIETEDGESGRLAANQALTVLEMLDWP
jgi:hypothetical protein